MHKLMFCRALLADCLTNSSILKMEVVSSSGTSVNLYQTILSHVQEDSTSYSHCYENFKTKRKYFFFKNCKGMYTKLDKI
jgi:hypothetical protein